MQEYNRVGARLQSGLLFLATVAMLVPSAVAASDGAAPPDVVRRLSVGLSVLLIFAYALGLLFSLKTHREIFTSAQPSGEGEAHAPPWPMALALGTLAGVTALVALVSEVFVESVQVAAATFGISSVHMCDVSGNPCNSSTGSPSFPAARERNVMPLA